MKSFKTLYTWSLFVLLALTVADVGLAHAVAGALAPGAGVMLGFMGAQKKRGQTRIIDGNTFTFASGQRQTVQVPVPGTFMTRLTAWLQGTLTISGVTVPGTVHSDGPVNLISQMELLLDGFPLKLGSGPSFFHLAQRYDRTDGVNDGLISAGAGVYTFEAYVPLLFAMPSSVNPFDSVLDGRRYRNMVFNLTWGTTASLVYGNTSTLALTNTTVQVYADETEPFAIPGGGGYLFRESETTFPGVVTSGATRLLMPYTQGAIIRSHQLRAIDGSDVSDSVINSLSLRINGGEQIPLNTLEDDFLQAYEQHYFGRDSQNDGYYHIEHSEGGLVLSTGLGAGVQPGGINSLEYMCDTTVGVGATSIVAHTAELLPPRA